MNPLLEVLCNEINKLKKALTTTGSDYTATVTKVEGDTAYVQIAGSDISDTPVALSVNADVGDHVRVRVANGKAWITGNDTLPPSNDKKAVGTKMMRDMSDRDDDIIIDFGKMEFLGNTLVVDSKNFKLDEDGNATFSGKLEAASAEFQGAGTSDQMKIPGESAPFEISSKNSGANSSKLSCHSSQLYFEQKYNSSLKKLVFLDMNDFQIIDFENDIRGYVSLGNVGIYSGDIHVWMDSEGVHDPSDIRLKEDVTTIDPETAKHLMPVQFRFKGDDKIHYGFIAQDVQKVIPDAVQEGETGYLTLTYHELIAPLYALVHEQEDRINQLEIRLKALEDKQ